MEHKKKPLKKMTRAQLRRAIKHLKKAMKPMPGQTLTFIDKDGVHRVKV
jgi:hypothetical protein